MSDSPLHRIPSISQLMELRPLKDLAHKVSSSTVAAGIKAYLEPYQKMAMEVAPALPYTSLQGLASEISHWILGKKGLGRPEVINATGQVLGRQFPAGPLAEEVIVQAHARRHDYHLASAQNDFRQGIEQLLCEMTGAEAAIVLQSREVANYLVTLHLSRCDTYVPRSQMSATFDGINLPKRLEEVGGIHEIGASNEIDFNQLRAGVQGKAARLLWFDRTNFDGPGSAVIPSTAEMLEALRSSQAECWVDLGIAGLMSEEMHKTLGLTSASQAIDLGADVVMLGGGFLAGGPSCGIVLGQKESIDLLRQMTLAKHLQAGEAALVELEACLHILQSGERIDDRLPLLSLLSTSLENLELRGTRLAEQLAVSPWVTEAVVREEEAMPLPGCAKMATKQIVLQLSEEGKLSVPGHLKSFPAVACFSCGEDEIVLDMRTIFPRQDSEIVGKFLPGDCTYEGNATESGEK